MQQQSLKQANLAIKIVKIDTAASQLTQGGTGGIPEYFCGPMCPVNSGTVGVTKYG
ncbi:MAG: acinetodin/klebsidin/J25 family lasso peptide [Achromobacter sp.]|uniref:acinetodin/klebsidin/J25 family lasso peptide n=1 Tax=Achromobacter sp. TaxID=134375 RepID=UPI003D0457FC